MGKLAVRIFPRPIISRHYGTSKIRPPIIRIKNGTFYRHHPNSSLADITPNPPLFENLNFELPSFASKSEFWSIIGPSSSGKTTFLQILGGKHLAIPPTARTYPFLESDEIEKKHHEFRNPLRAIKRVGFDGEQGLGAQAPQSAYLSARYESRREDTDFSVLNYLQGNTELNPSQDIGGIKIENTHLERVVKDLRLEELIDMPVSHLSNGQTRRARIARALLGKPEVLLLDEPFMGLDPPTLLSLSPLLQGLAEANAPRLLLSLRPQDPIPEWITHLIYLKGNCQIALQGPKQDVLKELSSFLPAVEGHNVEVGRSLTKNGIINTFLPPSNQEISSQDSSEFQTPNPVDLNLEERSHGPDCTEISFSRDGYKLHDTESRVLGPPIIEMQGAKISYGSKRVLGHWKQTIDNEVRDGLWWTVRRGESWGIFGPNGSGKTTILSLICSDHPQTYSLPIRLFGRSRLPEPGQPGISIFDLQDRIGHSSPEIHNHIPRSLTLRQVLENAWADTFKSIPKLDERAPARIDACLDWFEQDLRPGATTSRTLDSETATRPKWADHVLFGELPFSAQRVALFLRAIIKQPDLVILDEAFSGMDDGVRDRCLLFLAHGQNKTFRYGTSNNSSDSKDRTPTIEDSEVLEAGKVTVGGLNQDQALICISHVREEIPGSIREWICLPEANTGAPARFGRLNGPIEGDYQRWNEIWAMPS